MSQRGLIFERLWRECGIQQVLTELLRDRYFEFSIEPAVWHFRGRSVPGMPPKSAEACHYASLKLLSPYLAVACNPAV